MVQMFMVNVVLLAAGFFALIKGADWFVDGSSALAKNFHVPGLIIGLTIVALGTSAPELAVSISAALQGSNEIALSNVVGSDVFNLACVLGICAVIHPVPVDKAVLKRDFPLTIGAAVLALLVSGADWAVVKSAFKGPIAGAISGGMDLMSGGMDAVAGTVGRSAGLLLLVLFLAYILYLIHDARKRPEKIETGERDGWSSGSQGSNGGQGSSGSQGNNDSQRRSGLGQSRSQGQGPDLAGEPDREACLPLGKCALLILIGLGLIIAGGQVVVYSAKNIAKALGMSETLIGLTVVAVGTSLPELVTSVVAARKGETGLAIGNVVGSNLFNILFILGISAAICPIDVNIASIYDMLTLIVISLLTYIFSLSKGKIERAEGVTLLLFYGASVVFAVLR